MSTSSASPVAATGNLSDVRLPPRLTLFDAAALVVSNVIGVGIFTTPAIIAGMVPDSRWALVLWLFGGVLAFAGALTYAELGKICPQAGGEYTYLTRAFGPLAGFLAGWASLIAGFSGALAAASVALVVHLGRYVPALATPSGEGAKFLGMTLGPRELASAGVLLAFAAIHSVGWTAGKVAQRALALLVVGIIVVFVTAGFTIGEGSWGRLANASGLVRPQLWFVALIPVMFTYSGWNAAAYVSEEIHEPERNLGRALALGTLTTIAIYLALNALYFYAIPPNAIGGSVNVADVAAQHLFGAPGGFFTPLLIVAFAGATSAMTAAGSRVWFAMGRNGVMPTLFARLDARGTPAVAIGLQAAWSIVLVLFGGFEAILLYTGFTIVLSSGAAAVALFVLQRRLGVPRHPVRSVAAPALFAISALVMVVAAVKQAPVPSVLGLLLVSAGAPVFWLSRRLSRS